MQLSKPEAAGFSSQRLQRINQIMQRHVDAGDAAGMITSVARYGKTVHLAKFGLVDVDANRPMQFDTIFRLASMTKPVTSAAAMLLYEEGAFHLNTPISEFIPAFKNVEVFVRQTDSGLELEPLRSEITFRHLFTHTAGLTYGFPDSDHPIDQLYFHDMWELAQQVTPLTLRRMAERMTRMPLMFQPGARWNYSLSIDLIGHLIEIISGQTLDVFMRERLFEPLGMVDTAFWNPPEKRERQAPMYACQDDPLKLPIQLAPIFAGDEPPPFLSGGGGLFSTLSDYSRFAQMLGNGGELDGVRLFSPKTVAMWSANQAPLEALPYGVTPTDLYHLGYGYSLGTRVLLDVAQSGCAGSAGEFGWDGAFSSFFWVDPKESLYGIMMMQEGLKNHLHKQFKQLVYQALVA
jgi:CubicO group peptidase (beta-lactamase class C family)